MWGQLSSNCCNVTEVAQLGAPSCSRKQPATDNGVRDCKSSGLAVNPHPTQGEGLTALTLTYCTAELRATNPKTCCSHCEANTRLWLCQAYTLPVQPLRV